MSIKFCLQLRKKEYVILFVLFSHFQLFCQTDLQIRGQVIDYISGNALPFASLTLKNSQTGTIANDNGYYNSIPEKRCS